MISFICDSNVILFVVLILMFMVGRFSLVSFLINDNNILIIMLMVVSSIFCFVYYYIDRDVANNNFKLLKLLFLRLMIFILSSFGLLIFLR